MTIRYDYTIEEKELLRQIQELRNLMNREMILRSQLETDIKFIEARINNIEEIYPPIGRLLKDKTSPLMDMIVSLLAKFHRDGINQVSFPLLYDRIRNSALYRDKDESFRNDIQTAIHTSLDSLEYKGITTSINRGDSRLIQLSDIVRRPLQL